MANFYYVKSGGTATGNAGRVATTRSTGSFAAKGASAYYDNIDDAFSATTIPTSGDFVMCSSLHDKIFTASNFILIAPNVTLISVDDANCDVYKKGAKESATNGGSSLNTTVESLSQRQVRILGIEFAQDLNFILRGTSVYFYCYECTFTTVPGGAASGAFTRHTSNDGNVIDLKRCEFNFNSTGYIVAATGEVLTIDELLSTGSKTDFIVTIFGDGGASVIIRNSDLTQILAATGKLADIPVADDDRCDIYFENCKLPTSYGFLASAAGPKNHHVSMAGCGVGDNYQHFESQERYTAVSQDLATYLNTTYNGSANFSTKFVVASNIFSHHPFRYRLAIIPAVDLSVAKTISVECTSDASLTDNDLWIEVRVQDGTDQALGITQTTQPADVLAAGTALNTTGTGIWTAGDTQDYKINHDIGAIAAADNSNVEVWACIGKASINVNFNLPTIADT